MLKPAFRSLGQLCVWGGGGGWGGTCVLELGQLCVWGGGWKGRRDLRSGAWGSCVCVGGGGVRSGAWGSCVGWGGRTCVLELGAAVCVCGGGETCVLKLGAARGVGGDLRSGTWGS